MLRAYKSLKMITTAIPVTAILNITTPNQPRSEFGVQGAGETAVTSCANRRLARTTTSKSKELSAVNTAVSM